MNGMWEPPELTPAMEKRVNREVQKVLSEARNNEKNGPKAHHLVPNSYLKRWAVGDRIRVTETTSRKTWCPDPAKAATETHFYRMQHEQLDPATVPPLFFETLLSRIEGMAVRGIDHLEAHGTIDLSPDDAVWLSIYIAFQITRGRTFRVGQQELLLNTLRLLHPATEQGARHLIESTGGTATPALVAETLESLEALHSGKIWVAPATAEMISMSGQMAMQLSPHLLARDWVVYWTDLSSFITCDEPVVILNGPEVSRREKGGFGTADVVLFPLSPSALLAMFHPHHDLDPLALWPELDAVEVDEVNIEIAANSYRWMFERSDRSRTLTMSLPPLQPATRMERNLKLINKPTSELVRTTHPSRWQMVADPPPLPVRRWWPDQSPPMLRSDLTHQLLPPW